MFILQCPVFLLFLDCVYQLTDQLPKSFEFSEYYLTSLWDSLCSGLYSNFLFNSQHEMNTLSEMVRGERFTKLGSEKSTNSLLNVWDLSKQYTESDLSLFLNPAYGKNQMFMDGDQDITEPPRRTIKLLAKYYKEKPSDSFIDLELADRDSGSHHHQLYPEINMCGLSFWSGCFLRWLTPIHVVGGGMSMEYIRESLLLEEVKMIQNSIQGIEEMPVASDSSPSTQVSAMNFTPFWSTKPRQLLDNLTSSFPYTPSRPNNQVSFFGTPIKMCLEELAESELEASMSSLGDICASWLPGADHVVVLVNYEMLLLMLYFIICIYWSMNHSDI